MLIKINDRSTIVALLPRTEEDYFISNGRTLFRKFQLTNSYVSKNKILLLISEIISYARQKSYHTTLYSEGSSVQRNNIELSL